MSSFGETLRRARARLARPVGRAGDGAARASRSPERRPPGHPAGVQPARPAATLEHRLVYRGQPQSLLGTGSGPLVSVILPVKNGATDLGELLPLIFAQRSERVVEIVAVDSGSKDDTIEVLQRFGATVLAIEPGAFNHGLARNLAAGYAQGDVLVFVTQRARPADEQWLCSLVKPFGEDERIAGVCSRVLPRPDADLLTRRDTLRHLQSSSPERTVRAIADLAEYRALDPYQLRALIDFHLVSAAIRADVFARFPFRAVEPFGEDIVWAREVLEAGYKIQHEPTSVVLHSHNLTAEELFRRNFDAGVALNRIVGLRLDEGTLMPRISAMVRDDWRFLEEECELTTSELEAWREAAVLRRTAQVVGQWLGSNQDLLSPELIHRLSFTERFRAGLLPEEVRTRLERTATLPGPTSWPEREP